MRRRARCRNSVTTSRGCRCQESKGFPSSGTVVLVVVVDWITARRIVHVTVNQFLCGTSTIRRFPKPLHNNVVLLWYKTTTLVILLKNNEGIVLARFFFFLVKHSCFVQTCNASTPALLLCLLVVCWGFWTARMTLFYINSLKNEKSVSAKSNNRRCWNGTWVNVAFYANKTTWGEKMDAYEMRLRCGWLEGNGDGNETVSTQKYVTWKSCLANKTIVVQFNL